MNPESAKCIAALQPLILDPNGPPTSCMATLAAIGLCDVIGPAAADVRADLELLLSIHERIVNLAELVRILAPPIMSPVPMLLACPACDVKHVDEDEWATRPHRTHLCGACGALFRPALVPTIGVAALVEPNVVDAAPSRV